ncbi:hypothetical protein L7F22_024354 [Adiantum nelumboides]|nr:hypothetical protein [Adiantum nelumboides]
MSGLTEDLGSSSGDAVARRLYDPAFKLFGWTIPVSSECKGVSSGGQDQPDHPMLLASGEASSVQDVDDETPESEDESSTPNELGSSSGSNDGGDEEKMVDMINDDLRKVAMACLCPTLMKRPRWMSLWIKHPKSLTSQYPALAVKAWTPSFVTSTITMSISLDIFARTASGTGQRGERCGTCLWVLGGARTSIRHRKHVLFLRMW